VFDETRSEMQPGSKQVQLYVLQVTQRSEEILRRQKPYKLHAGKGLPDNDVCCQKVECTISCTIAALDLITVWFIRH
jgi:hypothetical protein